MIICLIRAVMPGLSLDVLPIAVQSRLGLFRPSLEPKAVFALDLDVWRHGFQSELDWLASSSLV